MALKTLAKPLAVTILLSSGLALLASWQGLAYHQAHVQQQAAAQYQQQLVAQAEYQQWLEKVQAMQPWLSMLQQGVTAHDWSAALTEWQQAHQQAWPDLELTQSQPAYNWQRYQLRKQLHINDQSDYQAWLAWQDHPFHPGLLPVQCRWQSQGHVLTVGQDSQAFKGTINCTWQIDTWPLLKGLAQPKSVPLLTQQDNTHQALSSSVPTDHLAEYSKAATKVLISATPIPAAIFSGVVADGHKQYVNINNEWSVLPMMWCGWQINDYDGYGLSLVNQANGVAALRIPLGQRLPDCERH
ncbi:hypothetical protein [Thiomicrospira sp. ALE5]|uniref:hypothetical protein n=1 Tax=Thiomicrospira sp. ALE5 TaxID=748650 RepID=UPI000B824C65|nr:hypothetical protein [Thiomicrospira sp. ALE5]